MLNKNFRKLVIQFKDIEKLWNFFKKVPNWEVSKKNILGIDYISFKGYGDEVIFACPKDNEKIFSSTNVLKQDAKMVEYEDNMTLFNLLLKDDILYKLYKDLYDTYKVLFSEENENASNIYDDSFLISIGLSGNDLA